MEQLGGNLGFAILPGTTNCEPAKYSKLAASTEGLGDMTGVAMQYDTGHCRSRRQEIRHKGRIAEPTEALGNTVKDLSKVVVFGLAGQLPFGRGDSKLTQPQIDREECCCICAFDAFPPYWRRSLLFWAGGVKVG